MMSVEILSIHTNTFNRALKEQDYAALEELYADDYNGGATRWFRAEQAGGIARPAEWWVTVSFD